MTEAMSKAALLANIQQGWDAFHIYLNTLTPEQLTMPTDAAGWTVKDHVMHLAVWEDGTIALLQGQPRRERMGVDKEAWATGDYDRINAVIQQLHKGKTLDEVYKTFDDVHLHLLEQIGQMTDEDLQRPHSHYQPKSDRSEPIIQWVTGNTYEHYKEHTTWIAAIVAGN